MKSLFKKKLSLITIVFFGLMAIQCQSKSDGKETAQDVVVPLKSGAEILYESDFELLCGKNVGLVTNHSAMVGEEHLADLLHNNPDVNLVALFGPEHGVRGDAAAGARIEDAVDLKTGVPAYSLYGKINQPTSEMMEGVDVLVFDIHDVGARFYTYITTMGLTMETAAEYKIPYVILDRPNPIGGHLVEGFMLDREYESFVGYYDIPATHGLTVGELATMAKAEGMLTGVENLDLTVVKIEGWDRNKLWIDYPELDWISPSPNIPEFYTALIYPGACFFEGVTASEGRGTQEPFMVVGAPWMNGAALAEDLNRRNLPGLKFEALSYTPQTIEGMVVNPKFNGGKVKGIRYIVTDPHEVRPVEAGVHLLHAFYKLTPMKEKQNFFRTSTLARLSGSEQLQVMIENGDPAEKIISSWKAELQKFETLRKSYFLYD